MIIAFENATPSDNPRAICTVELFAVKYKLEFKIVTRDSGSSWKDPDPHSILDFGDSWCLGSMLVARRGTSANNIP